MKTKDFIAELNHYIHGQRKNIFAFLLLFGFSMLLFLLDLQVLDASEIVLYLLMAAFLSVIMILPRKLISRYFDMSVSYKFWYMGLLISVILTLGSGLFGFYALFPIVGSLEYKRNRKTFTGMKSSDISNKEKTYTSLLMFIIYISLGLLLLFAGSYYSQEVFYQSGSFLIFLSFVSVIPYHKLEGLPLFYHNVFLYGIIAAMLLLILVLSFVSLVLAVYLFAAFIVLVLVSKWMKLL